MIRQDREDVFSGITALEFAQKVSAGHHVDRDTVVMQPCKVPSLPFCDPDGCDHCKESVRKHKMESIFKSLGE
jgi:hypothetical protein